MARESNYFEFLYNIVDPLNARHDGEFICGKLFAMQYRWDYTIPLDANLAENGIGLRRMYYEKMHKYTEMDYMPCTVFEMLVALSISISNAANEPGNDNADKWFWEMIDNLKLNGNEQVIIDNVGKWMARDYDANGNGGLFPLKYSPVDQRRAHLWAQANAYICEHV